ncbi:DUF2493 domain-containing protein [Methylobacterium currus]|uniref:DUF2493 domain-containing protein n=1 Tax=Methylobacterium currus TaxID=2051553 RepID=UPI0013DF86D9|nr:DUF2493 domain-containing protein [Methylobacterium currus]
MIIAVTGGRTFSERRLAFRSLDEVDVVLGGICGLVEGGASGLDTFAREWAVERGVPFETMPADWRRWGKAMAGRARNQDMLRRWRPFALVAFEGNEGTADMVERAGLARIPVIHATANGLVMPASLQ